MDARPYRQQQQPESRPSRSSTPSSTRISRLSKACDGCSLRKIKCDEQGPPCRACRSLDIPCTFNRPVRRRGPPNRHAENLREQSRRLSTALESVADVIDVLEGSLCPMSLVHVLIDDFYTLVYPLLPVPHEPWFRLQLRQTTESRFNALVASVLATIVSCHPHRLTKHVESLELSPSLTNPNVFIQKCHQIAFASRGVSLLQTQGLSEWDAITSFFLGRACAACAMQPAGDLLMSEASSILKAIGYGHLQLGDFDPVIGETDVIKQQMGRRLYWYILKCARSNASLAAGMSLSELSLSSTSQYRGHPPLPQEVNDEYITSTGIQAFPAGAPSSILSGFNASARIYLVHDTLAVIDMLEAVNDRASAATQQQLLTQALYEIETVLSAVPTEYAFFTDPPMLPENALYHVDNGNDLGNRRIVAVAMQRADLHIAYLFTRSLILERSWLASQTREGMRPLGTYASSIERLNIGRSLLTMLQQTPIMLQEGFSTHLGLRIRQIASTLLAYASGEQAAAIAEQDTSPAVHEEAASLMRGFVAHLTRLDQHASLSGMAAQGDRSPEWPGSSSTSLRTAEAVDEEKLAP